MNARFAHPIVRYLFAALTVAFTYGLRRMLDPALGEGTPFVVLFFLPVLVTAWVAGPGPAFVAAVLALILGDKVSFDPTFEIPLVARVARVGTFLLETVLLSALIESRRSGVEDLAQSEQRYRTLTENFPNGAVLLFDTQLRYLVAGGQGLSDVGLSPTVLLGKTPYEVFSDVADVLEPLYRGALQGRTQIAEVRWAGHDYLTYNLPVRDGEGAIIGGMVMTQDITQRKRLEEQLRQAQRMDAVGRLAGGIAHDFNNLLTVILGRTEMLLAAPENARTLQSDLGAVADAAQRASELTQQLLTFSRQQMLETQTIDLERLVQELAPTLRNLVGQNIELRVELTDSLGLCQLNRAKFEQVLMNLCVNARDAVGERGSITIRGESCTVTSDDAQHPGVPPGKYACLKVIDTGKGMDELTREHLFEPYFTTKGRDKGSGLGLSIVHGIVSQHHGHIAVHSQPGVGSEFHIYLPVVEAANTTQDDVAKVVTAVDRRGRGETILVVDDQADVREMLEEFLSGAGYRVSSAASAEEALSRVREQSRVDLVITDMVLPQMSGYELCRVLAIEKPETSTLLISGYSEQLVGLSHLAATGTLFLSKPFTLSELLEHVDRQLGSLARATG